MKRLSAHIVCLLFCAVNTGIFAQTALVTMTVYKDGYALIKQPVSWTVTRGLNTVHFTGLPEGLMTDSPFLNLSSGDVYYQRLHSDTFGGSAHIQKWLGNVVELRTVSGKTYSGSLLEAGPGKVSLLDDDELYIFPENQIEYIMLEESLSEPRLQPEMTWEIAARHNGTLEGQLTYLADGFDWDAIYRLILTEPGTTATFIPEAVVKNNSRTVFRNLQLKLVEGHLKRPTDGGRFRVMQYAAKMARAQGDMESGGIPEEEGLGDYHIFTLPDRMDLGPREQVTGRLYNTRRISINQTYIFENRERTQQEEPLQVELKISNTEKNQLGIPLPQGKVSMYYLTSDGSMEFAGQDRLSQVPRNGTATLSSGRAFDVIGKRRVLNYSRQRHSEEASIEITVENHRQNAVNVRVVEHITGEWVIRDESTLYTKEDASTIIFPASVPADSSTVITYTYRKAWQ